MNENVTEENEHFHNVSIVDQLQNISMVKYLVRAIKILEFHTKAAMHRETPFWIGENSILKGEVGFTYWENDYF